ncbi:hypothetical protein F4677DRAFT_402769 [Hypoxylon crocopeplum]|nr:hypothetical protein F4677DRAFT_402769 [Hypoxylon crocopeplum]
MATFTIRADAGETDREIYLPDHSRTIGSLKAKITETYASTPESCIVIHGLPEMVPDNAPVQEYISEGVVYCSIKADNVGPASEEEVFKGPKGQLRHKLSIRDNTSTEDAQQSNVIQPSAKSNIVMEAAISQNKAGGKAIQKCVISCDVMITLDL